jgi:hypothetical protein
MQITGVQLKVFVLLFEYFSSKNYFRSPIYT